MQNLGLKIVFFILIVALVVTAGISIAVSKEQNIIKEVLPAVVQIGIWNEQRRELLPIGSGVIVHPSGIILTVKHALADDGPYALRFSNGKIVPFPYYAMVDTLRDLAIFKIHVEEPLPFVPVGNDSLLEPGQEVLVFGYPMAHRLKSYAATVSRGILSATYQVLEHPPRHYLQIDAMVNPGSSGGPVVTTDGKVVGLVQSMVSFQGRGSIGINFAVPINYADFLLKVQGYYEVPTE